MTDQAARHLEDELARLRQLRNATLTMLRREGLSHEEKLHAIEPAFQEERDEGEHDEEAEAEERVAVTDRAGSSRSWCPQATADPRADLPLLRPPRGTPGALTERLWRPLSRGAEPSHALTAPA